MRFVAHLIVCCVGLGSALYAAEQCEDEIDALFRAEAAEESESAARRTLLNCLADEEYRFQNEGDGYTPDDPQKSSYLIGLIPPYRFDTHEAADRIVIVNLDKGSKASDGCRSGNGRSAGTGSPGGLYSCNCDSKTLLGGGAGTINPLKLEGWTAEFIIDVAMMDTFKPSAIERTRIEMNTALDQIGNSPRVSIPMTHGATPARTTAWDFMAADNFLSAKSLNSDTCDCGISLTGTEVGGPRYDGTGLNGPLYTESAMVREILNIADPTGRARELIDEAEGAFEIRLLPPKPKTTPLQTLD